MLAPGSPELYLTVNWDTGRGAGRVTGQEVSGTAGTAAVGSLSFHRGAPGPMKPSSVETRGP